MKYAQLNSSGSIVAFYDDAIHAQAQIGSATPITDAQWADCRDNQDQWPALAKILLTPAPWPAEVRLAAEKEAARVKVVSMHQARLALLGASLLAQVNSTIAAMPSPQKETAQIEWEYAAEVQRDSALIAALAGPLGLDAAAIDALFAQAVAL